MPRRVFSKTPSHVAKPESRLFSVEDVRSQLDELSRKPFMDLLALFIGNHPTPQNIQDFANRNPDKWSAAVSIFSKLTGYREEIEVTHNVYAVVKHMSDMDLEHRLRDVLNKTGDSRLINIDEVSTPYKRVGQRESAILRISKTKKILGR